MIRNANFLVFSAKPAVNNTQSINPPKINILPETGSNQPALKKQAVTDSWIPSSNPFTKPEVKTVFSGKNSLLKIKEFFQNNPLEIQKPEGVKKACDHLIKLLAKYDPYTADHSYQVAGIATQFAKSMNKFTYEDLEEIKTASLLHDIGKLGINPEILNKTGRLTNKEKELMDQHALFGEQILEQIGLTKNKSFGNIAALVGSHHSPVNKFSFFNKNKQKEDVIKLADVYNALTTKRSYKPAFSPQEAIGIMEKMQEENPKWTPDVFNKFKGFVDQNYGYKEKTSLITDNPFKQPIIANAFV